MIYERLVPLKNREVLLWSCREPKGVMKSCLLRAKPTFYVIQICGKRPDLVRWFLGCKRCVRFDNYYSSRWRFPVSGIAVSNRGTNSPISENNEAPTAMAPVRGGELVQVDVVEVTAMNLRLVAIWVAA